MNAPHYFWGGLRRRLLLILLLAILPAVVLLLFTTLEARRRAAEQVESDIRRMRFLVAESQGTLVEGTRSVLSTLAKTAEVRDHPEACGAFLKSLIVETPTYTDFVVANADGAVVCSATPLPGPYNVSDEPWFQRTLAGGAFAVGEYQRSPTSGQPILIFGYPLTNADGSLSGAVGAHMSLEQLNQLSFRVPLPAGADATTFDRNGTILTRYPDSLDWIGRTTPDQPLVAAILSLEEGVVEVPGVDGVTRLYGFTSLHGVEDFGLYLAVGIPLDLALAEIDAALMRNLGVMAVVSILALSLAFITGSGLVVSPVRALALTIQRLRGGDLTARIEMKHAGHELARLAEDLNALSVTLQQREVERGEAEALQLQNELYHRLLAEAGQSLNASLDYRERLQALASLVVPQFADWCAVNIVESDGTIALVGAAHADPAMGAEIHAAARRFPVQLDDEAGTARVLRTGQPEFLPEVRRSEAELGDDWWQTMQRLQFESCIIAPMTGRGRTLGAITFVAGRLGRRYTEADLDLALELSGRAGLALDNARLYEDSQALNAELERRVFTRTQLLQTSLDELRRSHTETRRLSARLQAAREEERTRIAREIHDELGGALTGLKMDAVSLRKSLAPDQTRQIETTRDMASLIDETVKTVRRIATELRPSILDDLGLMAAIEWLVQDFQTRTKIPASLESALNDVTLDSDSSIAVFRSVQESLTNVARHAGATEVRVCLGQQQGDLVATVQDNGRGIQEHDWRQSRSLGLAGMRERVGGVSGELEIRGTPGQGTRVTIRVPLMRVVPELDEAR